MSKLLLALLLALAPTAFANVWYVDGVHGNNQNNCKTPQTACKTIGHAISLASPGGTIGVSPATYAENLTIAISLNIIGAGASTTIIERENMHTAVVTISNAHANVTLSELTIQRGDNSEPPAHGGGIFNAGTLTINNSTISHNTADWNCGISCDEGSCGGIFNAGTLTINDSIISSNDSPGGAGIENPGKLTINNSTISGNFARGAGGGIDTFGTLIVNKSTITGNRAVSAFGGANGGGIANGGTLTINDSIVNGNGTGAGGDSYGVGGGIANGGTLAINNSTISGNSASGPNTSYGGGISNSSKLMINNSTISGNGTQVGGGIDGPATLQNSILADNSGGNCDSTMTSDGYNLSSDGTCNFSGPGDMNNTDPKLGTLGNHGGATQTIPLLEGSPAIDAGNPKGCTDGNGHLLKTDQRGAPRPDKEDSGGCDMGAFELQSD